MTNPVILLGTQSNGETLPVQVDAFGRLVAEGLQGPEGERGPQGEQGVPGPQGEPGYPEGGQEGQILQIVNGVPAWADFVPPVSFKWSDCLTASVGEINPSYPAVLAFDGDYQTETRTTGDSALVFAPPVDVEILTLETSSLFGADYDLYTYKIECNEVEQSLNTGRPADSWYMWNRFAGQVINESNPLIMTWISKSGSASTGNLSRMKINGEELIDDRPTRLTKFVKYRMSKES